MTNKTTFRYGVDGWKKLNYKYTRWIRGSVKPEDFGAKGDGLTNDTAAIQAAINTGKNVLFSEKVYLVENTINVKGHKPQVLFSLKAPTLKMSDGRSPETYVFKLQNCSDLTIHNLKFDGNKANQTQPANDGGWEGAPYRHYFTPILLDNAEKIIVENCEFFDCCTAAVNFSNSRNVKVRYSHFHDCYMDPLFSSGLPNQDFEFHSNIIERITYRDGNGDIVYRYGNGIVVNASDFRITNNIIQYCDRSGMKPTTQSNMNNIYIAKNKIENCDWHGIHPNKGYSIDIEDNTISGSGHSGILIGLSPDTGKVHDIGIKRNKITDSGTRDIGEAPSSQCGIMLAGHAYNLTLDDNEIDNCGTFGLLSVDAHGITTSTNEIRNCASRPVYIDGDGLPASDNRTYDLTMVGDRLYCEDTAVDGIKVGDYSYDLTFQDIEIHDPAEVGIFLQEPDNVLVKGCAIDGSNTYGIRLVATTNSTLENNTVTNTALEAIIFLPLAAPNSDNILVKNNNIDTARDGVRLYNTPTNITIENDNTYNNLTGVEVNWI